MSKYIIASFPTYIDAKNAVTALQNENLSNNMTILNKLPKLSEEDNSLKLDGVISGVTDVFIGLPAFVNPMSAADIPPQQQRPNRAEEKWEEYGIEKNLAIKYQKMIASGKTLIAIQSDNNQDQLQNKLKQLGAENTAIHSN